MTNKRYLSIQVYKRGERVGEANLHCLQWSHPVGVRFTQPYPGHIPTMEVTHGSSMVFKAPNLTHRGDGLGFKYLSLGEENTPENYGLILGRQQDFYSPRHHHNFDQFRYAVKGDFDLGQQLHLQEGQLAYHPEGTYYGPQNDGPEERILLTLQCGGASGQGYMSFAQLEKANQELSAMGKFEKGKYVAEDGSVRDGYEALWEHLNRRKLVYPKGRYHTPVLMDPESFAWKPVRTETQTNSAVNGTSNEEDMKAWKKTMGVFSEREIRAEMLKLAPHGTMKVESGGAIHLLYVLRGAGHIRDETLMRESTIRLKPGVLAEIFSEEEEMELLHFVMPLLSQS